MPDDVWAGLDQAERRRIHHLTAVDGRRDMVIVGRSAALVHGLEILDAAPAGKAGRNGDAGSVPHAGSMPRWPILPGDDVVELGHPTRRNFETRGIIRESKLRWGADDVIMIDDRPVTSVGATVADITRRHGFGHGLVAADSALRLHNSPIDLMRPAAHVPNPAQALRTVACASQFPDSAAESLLRAQIIDAGLPAPEVQLRVFKGSGIFIGRADLSYSGLLLMVEVHGKHKFSGRYGDGENGRCTSGAARPK